MKQGSWSEILIFYANGVHIELQLTMEAFDRMLIAYLCCQRIILLENRMTLAKLDAKLKQSLDVLVDI